MYPYPDQEADLATIQSRPNVLPNHRASYDRVMAGSLDGLLKFRLATMRNNSEPWSMA